MPKGGYAKRRYYRKRGRKPFVKKTKKLVTGAGPTLLEKIASYAGPVASVAKAVLPIVAAINTEQKYLDVSAAVTTATFASPYIVNLSALATGTSDITRIGNSILCKDLSIRPRVIQLATASTLNKNYVCRIVVFVDKMQNGTAPTLAQLMESTATIMSKFNKDYTDRFVILHDNIYTMHPHYSGAEYRQDEIKYFNKLDFHTRYLGSTAADADQGPNALYIMYWPESTTSGDFNVGGYSRLNFTDN